MLKLLIVDDEQFPRQCLAEKIPWQNYGVEVIATAGDGQEALERILDQAPDVVVTDIRMPRMDGIQFLVQLKARWPEIEAIIISGYEEFAYAKRAIALGVKSYILKPVDPAELLAAVLEIAERRAARAGSQEGTAEEYLRGMLYGLYTPERAERAAERFAELSVRHFAAVVLQHDNIRKAFDGYPQSPYNLLAEAAAAFCGRVPEAHFVDRNPHNMVFVIASPDRARAAEAADALSGALAERLSRCNYRDYAIGVGKICRGVGALGDAYLDALRAVNMKYIYGNAKVYRSGERRDLEALGGSAVDLVSRAVEATIHYDPDALAPLLSGQAQEFRRSNACHQEVQQFARAVIGTLMERLAEMDYKMEDIYTDPAGILLSICALEDVREIMDRVGDLLRTVGMYLRTSGNASPEQICLSAKRIIEKNYADADLSTKTIAESLHFSTAYLSALFSACSRTTVTNYINKVRIDNARALLRTSDLKVSAVARLVGYEHNSYFCTVFKRVAGCSPSEYRAAHNNG